MEVFALHFCWRWKWKTNFHRQEEGPRWKRPIFKKALNSSSLHDGITMMDEKSKKPRCKASAADFLVVRYIHRVFISSYFSVVELFMTSWQNSWGCVRKGNELFDMQNVLYKSWMFVRSILLYSKLSREKRQKSLGPSIPKYSKKYLHPEMHSFALHFAVNHYKFRHLERNLLDFCFAILQFYAVILLQVESNKWRANLEAAKKLLPFRA